MPPISNFIRPRGTAAQGSNLPAWLPAVGTGGNIGLNTIYDVHGTDSTTSSIFAAWSGCAFAPWYGTYGSLIFTGGGHGDGAENTIYRYDIATRMTSKIKPAATYFTKSDTYVGDPTTGWLWANSTDGDTNVQVGEPFTAHFYAYLIAVPPSSMSGGATNGWLYTPGRIAMSFPGQRGTGQAHKLRLGLDTQWSTQGASTVPFSPETGYAVYDSKRNRVWTAQSAVASPVVARWRGLTDDTSGVVNIASGFANGFNSYYCVGGYHTAQDLIMAVRWVSSAIQLQIYDPVTNTGYYPPVSTVNAPTTALEGAWDWSDTWNAWVFYPGDGTNTFYFLVAPSNPRTGVWTWSNQTVTGTLVSNLNSSSPGYNRIRHIPALGNLILWAPLYNSPVQAIMVSTPVPGPANVNPTVSMTSPTNGSSFTSPATITLTATASDSDGTVASVAFYQGSTLITTVTSSPYTYSWTGVANGNYTLTAVATDNLGGQTTSTAIGITVSGVTPNPPGLTNWALASNGSTASASSSYSANSLFLPANATNGDRRGNGWGTASNSGWNDDTNNAYPDWLQVTLASAKTISQVNVYTLGNGFGSYSSDPDTTTSSTTYGIVDFQVQTYNGSTWSTVSNGTITGNTKALTIVTFPSVTTTAVRVYITNAAGYSRIVELEVWGA